MTFKRAVSLFLHSAQKDIYPCHTKNWRPKLTRTNMTPTIFTCLHHCKVVPFQNRPCNGKATLQHEVEASQRGYVYVLHFFGAKTSLCCAKHLLINKTVRATCEHTLRSCSNCCRVQLKQVDL